MMKAEIIKKYFPELTERQQEQFEALDALYHDWNAKINVISRKDIDQLYEHHVLHSLAIAKAIRFRPGTRILDFGTGGGFPGVPLAILFPDCEFKLIDGTGKKIRVAQEVSQAIGLTNCHPEHLRGEDERGQYHFVVSRAVSSGKYFRIISAFIISWISNFKPQYSNLNTQTSNLNTETSN